MSVIRYASQVSVGLFMLLVFPEESYIFTSVGLLEKLGLGALVQYSRAL